MTIAVCSVLGGRTKQLVIILILSKIQIKKTVSDLRRISINFIKSRLAQGLNTAQELYRTVKMRIKFKKKIVKVFLRK